MPKRIKSNGVNPATKAAILGVIFGVPALFVASSFGLAKLFDFAPQLFIVFLVIACTFYTAYTSKLMHDFYDVDAPLLRFIPCVGELTLIDIRYRNICYVLYVLTVLMLAATQIPYSVLASIDSTLAINGAFYFMILALVFLFAIQIVKGFGLIQTMKDVEEDWYKHIHTTVGSLTKMIPLGFIPFVRVIAIYCLNKPLDTMVSYMGMSVDDEESSDFEEE